MREAAALPTASAAFIGMIEQLCRLWATDPDLLRRLVGLAAVDPDVHAVIASREQWRRQQVTAFVARLAEEDRLRAAFDQTTATAVVAALTAFDACDDIAHSTGRPIGELTTLLVPALGSIVRLGRQSTTAKPRRGAANR